MHLFQVVKNLMISHMELRNEDSPDVTVFTHKRNVDTVVVSLGTYLSSVRERFMLVCSIPVSAFYVCDTTEIIFLHFINLCSAYECAAQK
jgi:ERCC4-related helicase